MKYLLLLGIVLLRTLSDVCFKFSVLRLNFDTPQHTLSNYGKMIRNPIVWLAVLLAALNLVGWWFSLSQFDLSFAYPITALIYITIILAGRFIFDEKIDSYKWIGIAFIGLGVGAGMLS